MDKSILPEAEVTSKFQDFKVGDEITAKFNNFLDQELTVTGQIREVKKGVLCCRDNKTGRSFAVNFDEVINHQVLLGNDTHIENHVSPSCKCGGDV